MADQEDEVKLEAAEDQEVEVKLEELRNEPGSPEAHLDLHPNPPLQLVRPARRARIRWPDAPILDDGVNPTFEDWAWHVRVKCERDYPDADDQINYACIRTAGIAAACLRPRMANTSVITRGKPFVDLDDLIDHLSFLGDPDPRQTASDKLYSLFQEDNEPFATFWPKFATLIVELTDYPERAKVNELSGKLNLRLRKAWDLQVPRPETLLAARAYLHQVDANQRATDELFASRLLPQMHAEKPTEKPPEKPLTLPQSRAESPGNPAAFSLPSRPLASPLSPPATPELPVSLGSINVVEIVDEIAPTPVVHHQMGSRQPHQCRRCPEKFSSNTKLHQHVTAHHTQQRVEKSPKGPTATSPASPSKSVLPTSPGALPVRQLYEQRIKILEQENKEKTQAWAAEKAALQAQIAAAPRRLSPPAHKIRVALPPSPPASRPPSPPATPPHSPQACTPEIRREISATAPATVPVPPAGNSRLHEKFSWNKRWASITIHQLFEKFGTSWPGNPCSVRNRPIRFKRSNHQIPACSSVKYVGQSRDSNANRTRLRTSLTAPLSPRTPPTSQHQLGKPDWLSSSPPGSTQACNSRVRRDISAMAPAASPSSPAQSGQPHETFSWDPQAPAYIPPRRCGKPAHMTIHQLFEKFGSSWPSNACSVQIRPIIFKRPNAHAFEPPWPQQHYLELTFLVVIDPHKLIGQQVHHRARCHGHRRHVHQEFVETFSSMAPATIDSPAQDSQLHEKFLSNPRAPTCVSQPRRYEKNAYPGQSGASGSNRTSLRTSPLAALPPRPAVSEIPV
ncbi:MAG: hypothetical protein Q9223_007589 [Gallowayella weberi]